MSMREFKQPFKCGHARTPENWVVRPRKAKDRRLQLRYCKICSELRPDEAEAERNALTEVRTAAIIAAREYWHKQPFKCGHPKTPENSLLAGPTASKLRCRICLSEHRRRQNAARLARRKYFRCGHTTAAQNSIKYTQRRLNVHGVMAPVEYRRCRTCMVQNATKNTALMGSRFSSRCKVCGLSEPHSCLKGDAQDRRAA